jgi:hypothetical protein
MASKLKSAFNFGEGTGSSKIKKTQQDIEAQAAQDVAMDSGALPKSAFHVFGVAAAIAQGLDIIAENKKKKDDNNKDTSKKSGSYVKPDGKATGSMKDYPIGSDARKKEYDARGWKYDETIKGYNKDGTKKSTTTTTTKKDTTKKDTPKKGYRGYSTDEVTKRYKSGEVKKVTTGSNEAKLKYNKGDYEEGKTHRKYKGEWKGKIHKEKKKTYKGVDVLKSKVRDKGKLFGEKTYYKTDSEGNILHKDGEFVTTTKKEIRQEKRKERRENRKKRKENK